MTMFPLPPELVFKIMGYLSLEDNEQFTVAFPEYYNEIKEKKREFLHINYYANYRPVVHRGINKCVDKNIECVKQLNTLRKCFIGKFPRLISELFITDKTRIIQYHPRFIKNHKLVCEKDWLPLDRYIGKVERKTPYPFLFLRRADNREFITFWVINSDTWVCYIDNEVKIILKPNYIDFSIFDKIADIIVSASQ